MRILLINPNRVQSPPVPPIGLEYVACTLRQAGHEVMLLDLCFSSDIYADLNSAIDRFRPETAAVTVRNLDSVLFLNNEFYLDEIKDIVRYLKSRHGIKVIAGGSGFSADTAAVLKYIGADFGVSGPPDGAIDKLIADIRHNNSQMKIYQGDFRAHSLCRRDISLTDYRAYHDNGAIAGFETHSGCSSSCIYCIEANTPVLFRSPEDVIQEITAFTEKGFDHFHLCDAEFNEDLDQSIHFCTALNQSGVKITWTAYMKPANYNQKLFRLMKETGVNLITLTADSFKKCPLYWNDIEKMIFSAQANNIRIVVDFLTGFPYEDEDLLKWCLDFFRRLQPDCVNLNTHIRLYRMLAISKIIRRDPSLQSNLIGNIDDETMIRPVFYNQIQQGKLDELISGDKLFMIDGTGKGINHTRI